MSELEQWLLMKIDAYEEDKQMWDKGSEEYEYALGAIDAFQETLRKVK